LELTVIKEDSYLSDSAGCDVVHEGSSADGKIFDVSDITIDFKR
jgi:hypothetical protein